MPITIQELQSLSSRKVPSFKVGQTVRVFEKITEGKKSRTQIFEGLIIAIKGNGDGRSLTVRKIIGGFGVEKIFAIFSSSVEKIEIVKEAKVRRAKLYFMRDRRGKAARLREKFLTAKDLEKMEQKNEENKVSAAINSEEK